MTSGLASQNEKYPFGLGGSAQTFTIEASLAPARKPAKSTIEFLNRAYEMQRCGSMNISMMHTPELRGWERQRTDEIVGLGVPVAEHLKSVQAAIARLRSLAAREKRADREIRERNWLAAHRHEYRGQWIALEGDELLATGSTSKEVFAAVGKHEPTPLVIQIPKQEASFPGW